MRSLFIVCCFSMLSAACSSSATTATLASADAAGDTSASAASACAKLAAARCGRLDECSKGALLKERWGDSATCIARNLLSCTQGLAAPDTGSTPAHTLDCAAALTAETCTAFFATATPVACQAATGARAAGGSCIFSAQCQSGFCAIAKQAATGVCAAMPKSGDPCDTIACGAGLACNSDTLKCGVPALAGEACDKTTHCDAELSCVGADDTTSTKGKCTASGVTVGTACQGGKKTLPTCDANVGLWCDATPKTCAAWTFVADAQPCGSVGSGGYAVCQGGSLCAKAQTTDKTGVCVKPAADGAACDADPSKGPPCLSPARCVANTPGATAGTCVVPKG